MAANEALFKSGHPLTARYTPSGADVLPGEVIVVGDIPVIPHLAIPDGEPGAVAVRGGIYTCTAGEELDPGDKVYCPTLTPTRYMNPVSAYKSSVCWIYRSEACI